MSYMVGFLKKKLYKKGMKDDRIYSNLSKIFFFGLYLGFHYEVQIRGLVNSKYWSYIKLYSDEALIC